MVNIILIYHLYFLYQLIFLVFLFSLVPLEGYAVNINGLEHLKEYFHESISCIEKLLQDEDCEILANYEHIYDLIERVAEDRPESSILNLIDYRTSQITANKPEWLSLLHSFVLRFYKIRSTNVRIKVIQSLVYIMDLNRLCYEEEILERVVIPLFATVCLDNDIQLRATVTKALVEFARHCDTRRCGEILEILEKILNYPFEQYYLSGAVKTEADAIDVIVAVDGLIDVFQVKLYRLPSCHAIKIFGILIGHLELHYENPQVFDQVNIIRYNVGSTSV